jgi:hypothetical protein
MNTSHRSPVSSFRRRPLIAAVKTLIAGTFLGGCRLGMQRPPPISPQPAPAADDAGAPDAADGVGVAGDGGATVR